MSFSEIKYALNSTIGTPFFKPLDELLKQTHTPIVIFEQDDTFTVPYGVTVIYVTAFGGGGGGGGGGWNSSTTSYAGAGGGGEGGKFCNKYPIQVTEGEEIPITIGKGGAGGERALSSGTSGLAGLSGGITSVGEYLSLSGGAGGKGGTTSSGGVCTPDNDIYMKYGEQVDSLVRVDNIVMIKPTNGTTARDPLKPQYVSTGGTGGTYIAGKYGAGGGGNGGSGRSSNSTITNEVGARGNNGMVVIEFTN